MRDKYISTKANEGVSIFCSLQVSCAIANHHNYGMSPSKKLNHFTFATCVKQ